MRKTGIMLTAMFAVVALLGSREKATAQTSCHGEKTLGIRGGYAGYNDSGFADLYFQYSFSDHVRISPEIGYVFKNDHKSALTISADMQFPFRVARGIKVYPLAGLTFNKWNTTGEGGTARFGGDLGGGFDFYMTNNLKLSLECKYSFMKKTSGVFAGLGIGYIF